jgi:hypothetical protein
MFEVMCVNSTANQGGGGAVQNCNASDTYFKQKQNMKIKPLNKLHKLILADWLSMQVTVVTNLCLEYLLVKVILKIPVLIS